MIGKKDTHKEGRGLVSHRRKTWDCLYVVPVLDLPRVLDGNTHLGPSPFLKYLC